MELTNNLMFLKHSRALDVVWRILDVATYSGEVIIRAEAWSMGALEAYSLDYLECIHIKTDKLKDWAFVDAKDGSFLRYKRWTTCQPGVRTGTTFGVEEA